MQKVNGYFTWFSLLRRIANSLNLHAEKLPMLIYIWFQVLFHSLAWVLFIFPLRYLYTISHWILFWLSGWSHWFQTEYYGFHFTLSLAFFSKGKCCLAFLNPFGFWHNPFYRAFTLSSCASQHIQKDFFICFRSPLLTESRLIFFP